MAINALFVVVGGGVAGICCVEELENLIGDNEISNLYDKQIILISGRSGFIKVVTNTESVLYKIFYNYSFFY